MTAAAPDPSDALCAVSPATCIAGNAAGGAAKDAASSAASGAADSFMEKLIKGTLDALWSTSSALG